MMTREEVLNATAPAYAHLRRVDLRGVDLCGVDLSYTDMSYSNLRGANMNGAKKTEQQVQADPATSQDSST